MLSVFKNQIGAKKEKCQFEKFKGMYLYVCVCVCVHTKLRSQFETLRLFLTDYV